MNQEDLLVLLLVFVLGFVVSQMMSGRLVEGGLLGDIEDDFKSLGKHIGDDTSNIVHNRGVDFGKHCTTQGDCTKACAFGGQYQCYVEGTQNMCNGQTNCKCDCDD